MTNGGSAAHAGAASGDHSGFAATAREIARAIRDTPRIVVKPKPKPQ